jgi:hypothetical protein
LPDACALLKGQTPRPPRNPSILQRPSPTTAPTPTERRRGKPTRPRTRERTIHREVPLHPPTLPEGAVFQGFEPYLVQDLLIQSIPGDSIPGDIPDSFEGNKGKESGGRRKGTNTPRRIALDRLTGPAYRPAPL